ncbi:MAG: hypothetical protein KDA30_13475 [Phycisphaerales bacterium]|nr:hypothetical protein [Phycisphaerales bacterium]
MEPSELPMPIPTIDDLTQRLGFRPPVDLVRLVKLAHELDPEGGYNGLDPFDLRFIETVLGPDASPDRWDTYPDQPLECFAIAHSGIGNFVPVILVDDPDRSANNAVFAWWASSQYLMFYADGIVDSIAQYGVDTREDLDDLLNDSDREQFMRCFAAFEREFGVKAPPPTQNPSHEAALQNRDIALTISDGPSYEGSIAAFERRLAQPGIHPTADGAGALVPKDKTDRAYLRAFQDDRTRRNKLPHDEQGVAVRTILAKTRDRLDTGESGTALVVARDLWHDCGGEDTPLSRSITELLIDAYTALDRPLLARRARARMDWVIEVDREFEERRKRREREQAEH